MRRSEYVDGWGRTEFGVRGLLVATLPRGSSLGAAYIYIYIYEAFGMYSAGRHMLHEIT